MQIFHFCCLVGVVTAASFTSVKDEPVTQADFPFYLGDRIALDRIIAMSGTVATHFPRDAKCLDDILTEEHLLFMLKALAETNLKYLGELLSELSPQRFDSLCAQVDAAGRRELLTLVNGYQNRESRWKQAFELDPSLPITENNAHLQKTPSEELCNFMESRPADILTIEARNFCLRYWARQGKHHLIRRLVLESPNADFNTDLPLKPLRNMNLSSWIG